MRQTTPGRCCVCGCTEYAACPGPCGWANAERTLCTRCVEFMAAFVFELKRRGELERLIEGSEG